MRKKSRLLQWLLENIHCITVHGFGLFGHGFWNFFPTNVSSHSTFQCTIDFGSNMTEFKRCQLLAPEKGQDEDLKTSKQHETTGTIANRESLNFYPLAAVYSKLKRESFNKTITNVTVLYWLSQFSRIRENTYTNPILLVLITLAAGLISQSTFFNRWGLSKRVRRCHFIHFRSNHFRFC